jgi:hypothetical protein
VSIDQVLAGSPQHNLPSNTDLGIFLESDGRLLLVAVIENYCNAGLGNAGLPTLVNKILCLVNMGARTTTALNIHLEILRSDCRHTGDAQAKYY